MAVELELSQSVRYTPVDAGEIKNGLRFYMGLVTVDPAESEKDRGKRSVVSIVIEDFGLPDSYPVPDMWYHKVVVVDQKTAGKVAKDLLDDMDARWCNYIRNSVGGCSREKFDPHL